MMSEQESERPAKITINLQTPWQSACSLRHKLGHRECALCFHASTVASTGHPSSASQMWAFTWLMWGTCACIRWWKLTSIHPYLLAYLHPQIYTFYSITSSHPFICREANIHRLREHTRSKSMSMLARRSSLYGPSVSSFTATYRAGMETWVRPRDKSSHLLGFSPLYFVTPFSSPFLSHSYSLTHTLSLSLTRSLAMIHFERKVYTT